MLASCGETPWGSCVCYKLLVIIIIICVLPLRCVIQKAYNFSLVCCQHCRMLLARSNCLYLKLVTSEQPKSCFFGLRGKFIFTTALLYVQGGCTEAHCTKFMTTDITARLFLKHAMKIDSSSTPLSLPQFAFCLPSVANPGVCLTTLATLQDFIEPMAEIGRAHV